MRSELASTNESRSTSRPMNPVSTWSPTARLISACGCASVLSPLMEPEASGAGSGVASSHAGRHGLVGASMFFVFVCPFERENHPLFGWPMTDQSFYVHSYWRKLFSFFSCNNKALPVQRGAAGPERCVCRPHVPSPDPQQARLDNSTSAGARAILAFDPRLLRKTCISRVYSFPDSL
jgi:hypothetical protein